MRLGHFEAVAPVCPRCRLKGEDHPLALTRIAERTGDWIDGGVIECPSCRAEYPIVTGLPILVPDLRSYVGNTLYGLTARDDLPAVVADVLTDAAGQGSALESMRRYQSSYGFDHWGDLDPDQPASDAGSVARLLHAGLADLTPPAAGDLLLDIGCGPGRSTFELAAWSDGLVLGLDLDATLARAALGPLCRGEVCYPKRRIGLVHEERRFALSRPEAGRVDIWIADVLALPIASNRAQVAAALNLIDCVTSPVAAIASLARALTPGGRAVIATPFDWSAAVTPIENWLGGHSARGSHHGAAEPILDAVVAEAGLTTLTSRDVPWQVRLHDRAAMLYECRLLVVEKPPCACS